MKVIITKTDDFSFNKLNKTHYNLNKIMKITSRDHFIENKINFKLPSTSRNGNKRSTKEDEFCKQEDNIAIQSERKTHSRASSVTTYETILKNKQNVMK